MGSVMEAQGVQGIPKRPKMASILEPLFHKKSSIFVTRAPNGPVRWPQGATVSQNGPNMLQKVIPPGSQPSKIRTCHPPSPDQFIKSSRVHSELRKRQKTIPMNTAILLTRSTCAQPWALSSKSSSYSDRVAARGAAPENRFFA